MFTIRKRHLLLSVAFICLVVSVTWYMGQRTYSARVNDVIESEQDSLFITSHQITQDLAQPAVFLDSITSSPDFIANLDEVDTNPDKLARQLQSISEIDPLYFQVRWIDENGVEKIRFEHTSLGNIKVPPELLQNKKQRYYFTEAMKLAPEDIYFSDIDLNVERGKVQRPYKPTLRIAKQVFDSEGNHRGIVIINRDISDIIDTIRKSERKDTRLLLVNHDGHWLRGFLPRDEWGFMFKRDSGVKDISPKAWQKINTRDNGAEIIEGNAWIWSIVNPVHEVAHLESKPKIHSSSYKLISYLPADRLYAIKRTVFSELTPYYLVFGFVFLGMLGSILYHQRKKQKLQEKLDQAQLINRIKEQVSIAEHKFQQVVNTNINGMLVVNDQGEILMINPALERMFGYEYNELLHENIDTLIPKQYSERHRELVNKFTSVKNPQKMVEGRIVFGVHKDGHDVPVEVTISTLPGKDRMFAATIVDITTRLDQEDNLNQLASVFKHSNEGIFITDDQYKIVNANQAYSNISGYNIEDIIGKPAYFFSSKESRTMYDEEIRPTLEKEGSWRGEFTSTHKNGEQTSQWLSINKVDKRRSEKTFYAWLFTDIDEIKKTQQKLEHLLHHDTLTELPNRLLLSYRVEHAVSQIKRYGYVHALLFIDIDDFKHVNDGLGHEIGDQLLQEIGRKILSLLREQDTVARLGGDEFVVFLEDVRNTANISRIADKIRNSLDTVFNIEGHDIHITASIGVSCCPQDGDHYLTLLRNADSALYSAKDAGKNRTRFYTESFTQRSSLRLEFQRDLKRALENNELFLVYQPQISLVSGKIIGAEALVRWQHPEKGLISPGDFIPMAEELGLIEQMELWIFHAACEQAKIWHETGIGLNRVAINISGTKLQSGQVPYMLKNILNDSHCPEDLIELEISENFIMKRGSSVIKELKLLNEMNIQLSIDDFGTGYSSLSYLKQLPIDMLKIDQSFIRDLGIDGNDRAIVSAIIAMCKKLNLEVIAEGVETLEQAKILRTEGCYKVQGYHYCKPLIPADFEAFTRDYDPEKNILAGKVVPIQNGNGA